SIIVQNENIIWNETIFIISEYVQELWVGSCASVHLSGETLSILPMLEKLTIHDTEIHLAVEFLQQYSSHLRHITLSSCTLGSLQSSLDLYIHKLSKVLLQNCVFTEQLNILIRTEENHILDYITIKNCTIDTLGEINLSQRKVKEFTLFNNVINRILPSTILHDTETTAISGNLLDNLDFLAMEVNTQHFTLQGNKINKISRHALIVNNASIIKIESNTFSNIEKQAFVRLRPQMAKDGRITGTLILSNNHFYRQQPGSLIFHWSVYDGLKIANNYFYTELCNCSDVLMFLHKMIEGNRKIISLYDGNQNKVYNMFKDTSYCQDAAEASHSTYINKLCGDSSEFDRHNGGLVIIVVLIFLALILGGLLLREFLRCRKSNIQDKNHDQTWELISTEIPVNDSESDD
ncbi:unnamed protein product, partial [Meganyctiphanes norvegica]